MVWRCMPHPSDDPVEPNVIGVGDSVLLLIFVDDVMSWGFRCALGERFRAIGHDILDEQ